MRFLLFLIFVTSKAINSYCFCILQVLHSLAQSHFTSVWTRPPATLTGSLCVMYYVCDMDGYANKEEWTEKARKKQGKERHQTLCHLIFCGSHFPLLLESPQCWQKRAAKWFICTVCLIYAQNLLWFTLFYCSQICLKNYKKITTKKSPQN